MLPLIEAQCCSRCMLDDVSREVNVDHDKKSKAQLAEFLASGGKVPERHDWNLAEHLEGSRWEQQVQPKSK